MTQPQRKPQTAAKVLDLLLLTAGKYKMVPGWGGGGLLLAVPSSRAAPGKSQRGRIWGYRAHQHVIYSYLQPPSRCWLPAWHPQPPGAGCRGLQGERAQSSALVPALGLRSQPHRTGVLQSTCWCRAGTRAPSPGHQRPAGPCSLQQKGQLCTRGWVCSKKKKEKAHEQGYGLSLIHI